MKKTSVITSIAYQGADGIYQANVVREDFRVWRVDAWRYRRGHIMPQMCRPARFATMRLAQSYARSWVDREG